MLKILDISEELGESLSSEEVKILCQVCMHIPLKVVINILDTIAPNPSWETIQETLFKCNKKAKMTLKTMSDPAMETDTEPEEEPSLTPAPTNSLQDRNAKATKSDDAEIPEYLWNETIFPSGGAREIKALNLLRDRVLRWWRKNLMKEFIKWFHDEHLTKNSEEVQSDLLAGLECITRSCGSTFWEWTEGSRPFFWRWPLHYRKTIKEGHPLWVKETLPRWRIPQRRETNQALQENIKKKLESVRTKGYISPGPVISLTLYFAVPKEDSDIRIVYDGTKSGLNGSLWAPWFPLPTIETHLPTVDVGSYMGDIDIGEMFLNFMLHPRLRPYAGVDLTPYFGNQIATSGGTTSVIWERWDRCTMGFKRSPYIAIQGILMAEEFIRGDPQDPNNVFRWEEVELNLPGSSNYVPSKPWMSKLKLPERTIACDMFIYVDDVRTTGDSYLECQKVSRVVASLLNFLGLQDAVRKRRDPSQTLGPWAGFIVLSDGPTVETMVSQERWEEAKSMVRWMRNELTKGPQIEFKALEKYRGYLVYISCTYPAITFYLKGIHLTLDSWRPWRRDDGWKMTLSEMRVALEDKGDNLLLGSSGEKAPKSVSCVPRFPDDITALETLFDGEHPPKQRTRPRKQAVVIYKFGDASGIGFGSSFTIDGKVYYRHGQWSNDHSQESSNHRELANLIFVIEDAYVKGFLQEAELFIFTDNSMAESAFFKGTSKNKKLFKLILRLRKLEMGEGVIMRVIHVAVRMMAEGTDSLSRGVTTSGIMQGLDFCSFVPLHLSTLERHGDSLRIWVESWFQLLSMMNWLEPKDWFHKGHLSDNCIWTPPPAAAEAALEQLGKSIHKRPQHTHLVLCPRLMTAHWRKVLGKICDLVFTIPLGVECWSLTQYEPLIAGLCFPLCRHPPWKLRGIPIMECVERKMWELPPTTPSWGRLVLRELLKQTRSLDAMPPGLVRSVLYGN
jgi:hypothetical protein